MEKKYELVRNQPRKFTNGTKKPVDVFPIRALKPIPSLGIQAGDVGGNVQSEENLSQFDNCWIFQGSTVSHGGRVTDNAIVMGDSAITENAMVMGSCRIEHSKIQEGSLISGEVITEYATVTGKSTISGDFRIQDSEVHGIKANKGKISESRIQSKEGKLSIKAEVSIEQCKLEITDGSPIILQPATLIGVTARELVFFRIWERTTLVNAVFENPTELYFGLLTSEGELETTIEGESRDNGVRFDGVTLDITDSTIQGNVTIKGEVHLIGCTLSEFATIENHTEANLKLKAVNLSELASIVKEPHSTKDTFIEAKELQADIQLSC